MKKYVCVHGHFYQPPRENPWFNIIETEESARPYKNWNYRVGAECYAPNSFARILNEDKRIVEMVNNYSYMSFNIGPTLFQWLQEYDPEVYEAILESDKISRERFNGHGGAIAQIYNHMIMPLANKRDKMTQVKWGIEDFTTRFKRYPEGMWLPETAVDLQTLEALAAEDIKFTILAPHQAKGIKLLGSEGWHELKSHEIDTGRAYLCRLPSGNTMNLFFYNGELSHAVGFGTLLNDGKAFAQRLIQAGQNKRTEGRLVHIATDGETFGHHHRFGEMALAYCFDYIEKSSAEVTVYADFLEKFPPEYEVQIHENTSWSCPHGVERWRNDCGCHTGRQSGWHQSWRKPLREAMNWMRDEVNEEFAKEFHDVFKDPWAARDEYIQVILDRSPERGSEFFMRHMKNYAVGEPLARAISLMELQLYLMLIFTSCGWFFDDITEIATIQVLRYGVYSIHIAGGLRKTNLEKNLLFFLEQALSNSAEYANGSDLIRKKVMRESAGSMSMAVQFALQLNYDKNYKEEPMHSYKIMKHESAQLESPHHMIFFGKMTLKNRVFFEVSEISYVIFQKVPYDIEAYATESALITDFKAVSRRLELFNQGKGPPGIEDYLCGKFSHRFYLQDFFKDFQAGISYKKLGSAMEELERNQFDVFIQNYRILFYLMKHSLEIPRPILAGLANVLSRRIAYILESDEINLRQLKKYLSQARKFNVPLYVEEIEYAATDRIYTMMVTFLHENGLNDIMRLKELEVLIRTLAESQLELDIWKVQNLYYKIWNLRMKRHLQQAKSGDEKAQQWIYYIKQIGIHIKMELSEEFES